jgi:hypothetical protein
MKGGSMATRSDTKKQGKAKAALNKAFESNPIAKALMEGRKVERSMDYGRAVDKYGHTYAQVAVRRDYVILERIPDGVEIPNSLKPAGEPSRMRFRVEEGDVETALKVMDDALEIIRKSHAARGKKLETKQAKTKASKTGVGAEA